MKSRKTLKNLLSTIALSAMALAQVALASFGAASIVAAKSDVDAPDAIIYDNGPFATGSVSRSGVAAPTGAQWSESSYNYGSTTEADTLSGVGCQTIGTSTGNRCADDFNVPVGQTWTINQVITYSYQSGFAGTTSPFVGATLRIWNGPPGAAGSTVVFGDTTTNRLGSSTDSGVFRIFNSGPPANSAPGTTRRIWRNAINVSPAAVLTAGNYWIDWSSDAGAGGNFSPPATITGTRGVPGWNAMQSVDGGATYAVSFDDGTPVTAADVNNDFPFKLDGTIAGAPAAPRSRTNDYDGDNRTDFVVARAANATSQATWWTSTAAGSSSATPFGLGVGFSGGDIATPSDFDGDGKADIAVWRSNTGDPTKSYFYILQSSNSTVLSQQFGKTGDDPTIVGDYDGDGKADMAVFRSTVGSGDPCGSSAVWYYKPSAAPATTFAYSCWGSAGDKPYPGDFDGDRKYDFSVVRNSGGNGVIYQNRTTAGSRVVNFGLFSDLYVTGDFDADGRTDLCAVRTTAGGYEWNFTDSGNGQTFRFIFGNTGDYITPGDYDGDNKTDFALWRSGTSGDQGNFYPLKTFTSPNAYKWGQSAGTFTPPDYPVATSVNVH
jgi:FG-GAP-like repeat